MLMQKNKRYFDFKINKIDSISSSSMPGFVLNYSKEQIIELFQICII